MIILYRIGGSVKYSRYVRSRLFRCSSSRSDRITIRSMSRYRSVLKFFRVFIDIFGSDVDKPVVFDAIELY